MAKKKDDSFLKREEITIRSNVDSKDIFRSTPVYAGDSVDQHKQLEEVNEMFSEKEIKQSNENS
ncbi:hypothetical protein [Anaerobacillus arseniciselenatis]|uniref:hypothetical protein n=1 Tax=Anaerobacillus arseniciselenatis TaxID=85682 RepID=UPI001FDF7322|nr:hypothetical protein [Anaerobacillus arseniciselenatis]